jgi:pilus assembly protein CpaB
MKPKTLILMLVAVSCGLVASFMTSKYLAASQQPVVVEEEKVPVLVTKKKLTGYTRLNDPEAFEIKQWSKNEVTKDAIDDFEKIKGRVLKHSLSEGKPLAESDLVELGMMAIEHKLNPGEIAVAIKVNPDENGAGYILPGSRVDVQATQSRQGQNEKPFSKFILQNIEVLAVGQDLERPEGVNYKDNNRVVLRLKHKEAELLDVYKNTGTIRLVIRRQDDVTNYDTPGGRVGPGGESYVVDGAASNDSKPGETPSALQAPTIPASATDIPLEAPKREKRSMTIINGKVTVHEFPHEEPGTEKK